MDIVNEKYVSDVPLKDKPRKKISLRIREKSITNPKIAEGAVTNEKIADGTLTGEKFVNDSIDGVKVKDNSVPGSKLADGSITGVDIEDGTLSGAKLVDNSVSGSKLEDDSIESRHLLDNSVPGSKIKDNSLQGIDFQDGSISGEKIVDESITSAKIADNAITENKIAEGAVTTAKLANDSVTTQKIVDGAVTTDKIGNGEVKTADISDEAVTAAKIADGSVSAVKIASNAVTENKLADGSVIAAKIAANAVTTAKIGDGEVTEGKIANGAITTEKLSTPVIEQLQTIMDDVPTVGSVKPVSSGGVLVHGSAFDVSEYNKSEGTLATYETLSDALDAIPSSVKKGGMSIKFVQSSDNKYIQARCMAQNFTTDVTQWQGMDAEPIAGSRNLVESGGVAPIMTIIDDVLITKGKAYNTNTGVYADSKTMFCSPMLKLSDINPNYLTEGIKFISGDLTTPTQSLACITWFDSTKTKISDTGISQFIQSRPITASVIPSNAVYAIFNSNKSRTGTDVPVVFEGYGLSALKAKDAEMSAEIQTVNQNINQITNQINDLKSAEIRVGSFKDSGEIRNINNDRYYFIPVQPSTKVLITVGSIGTYMCVCKSDNGAVVGQTLDLSTVSGFTQRIRVPASTTTEYIMPSDAAYIAVVKVFNNEDWNVSSIKVDSYEALNTLKGNVEDVAKQLGGYTLWKGTQADYDAIATKDSNTIYLIVEG